MSRVIAWVKANLVTVLMLVLMLTALPVGYVFSSSWNGKIRAKRESQAKAALSQLGTKVTYVVPAVLPDVEAPTLPGVVPNDAITDAFKTLKEEQAAEVSAVVEEATAFNRNEHAPLIAGLFPAPDPARDQLLRLEMAKTVTGENGPDAFTRLLSIVNAGMPEDPTLLAQRLQDAREREMEKLGPKPDEEMVKEIERRLFMQRLGSYQSLAQKFSVWADKSVFAGSSIPEQMPPNPPSIEECFQWQFDQWAMEEIMRAVRLANTGSGGRPLGITLAPIKRIIEVSLVPMPLSGSAQEAPRAEERRGRGRERRQAAEPVQGGGSPKDLVQVDESVSITGRKNSPNNQVYDVRRATVVLIVASRRLPEVIDAFSRANFMSVLDVDLARVDEYEHLGEGFYYGTEDVVEASLEVEIVLLRRWTAPLMPEGVRTKLGVVLPEPATDAEGGGPG